MHVRQCMAAAFALAWAACSSYLPPDNTVTDTATGPAYRTLASARYKGYSALGDSSSPDPVTSYDEYSHALVRIAIGAGPEDEIMSVIPVDSVAYLDVITANTDGTRAEIFMAEATRLSYSSTAGNGYVVVAEGYVVDQDGFESGISVSTELASARPWQQPAYSLAVASDGTVDWYYGRPSYGTLPAGKLLFSDDWASISLDAPDDKRIFTRDKNLPGYREAEVACSAVDRTCQIRGGE